MSCSKCTWYDPEKVYETYNYKCWCGKKNEWVYANQAACWLYCEAYGRSSQVAESYYRKAEESQRGGSGCFITTIVCSILGNKDDFVELEKLRAFRDNVLQKDQRYNDLLVTYDYVGPIISQNIIQDKNRVQIATNLYNFGIKKVVEFLDKNEKEKAIQLYISMTEALMQGYNLEKPEISNEELANIDRNQMGHGRQYVKKYA